MSEIEPQSPCISVCVLDTADICQGCFRSATEITDWLMSSSAQKYEILNRAQQRRDEVTTIRLK